MRIWMRTSSIVWWLWFLPSVKVKSDRSSLGPPAENGLCIAPLDCVPWWHYRSIDRRSKMLYSQDWFLWDHNRHDTKILNITNAADTSSSHTANSKGKSKINSELTGTNSFHVFSLIKIGIIRFNSINRNIKIQIL